MSSQLLSSASSSSSSSASSSVSPSPSSSSGGGKWRRKGRSCSRRRKGRAGRRPGTAEGVVKKNAREKERVLVVRREYEILGAELGDLVERGSGHFSKNRTLAAAIHCIDRLEASRHLASGSEEPTASTRSPSPLPDVPVQVSLRRWCMIMSPTHLFAVASIKQPPSTAGPNCSSHRSRG